MLLATPGTWTDALAWFIEHQRERLDMILTQGCLTIEGPALYERVDQLDDQFGVVLTGLCFWITESQVERVWIDPEDDGILVIAADLWLYLRPKL